MIDAFKKTMPLITDLRNPAIRPRHWQAVMDNIGQQFDPHGDDFTLGRALHVDPMEPTLKAPGTKRLKL